MFVHFLFNLKKNYYWRNNWSEESICCEFVFKRNDLCDRYQNIWTTIENNFPFTHVIVSANNRMLLFAIPQPRFTFAVVPVMQIFWLDYFGNCLIMIKFLYKNFYTIVDNNVIDILLDSIWCNFIHQLHLVAKFRSFIAKRD